MTNGRAAEREVGVVKIHQSMPAVAHNLHLTMGQELRLFYASLGKDTCAPSLSMLDVRAYSLSRGFCGMKHCGQGVRDTHASSFG